MSEPGRIGKTMPSEHALGLAISQALAALRKAKKRGRISHWELETSDSHKGLFGVRVSKIGEGVGLFGANVSATYYGRDLRSQAEKAIAEVNRSK